MAHPIIEQMVQIMADAVICDYEKCPGRTRGAAKRMIYHQRYLFVHRACVQGAREAARERGETFGFRSGI